MRSRKFTLALTATLATLALAGMGPVARATFPDFTGCNATDISREACIDIQQRSGNLNIKGFNVPLHETMEIRGKLLAEAGGNNTFVPPTGTNGFFTRPVSVPGGIFGIEWLPGNEVLAITELAGSPSLIHIDTGNLSVRIPIKVRLVNLLLGMDCHIGTNSNPVVLNLITGTTSPPPPNTPISGRTGTQSFTERAILIRGNVNVENSFAVPGATECGLGLGLINSLVNLRLRLPSAAGNNSAEATNDVALGLS
ncbi:MAG: hypothetical protein JSS99_07390 [Actinobacteria bacterium]|nr:hypothetical protein [Actinomycetota bacterium]